MEDQLKFWPFVYLGLNGEASVSKSDKVAFSGTPPQSVIGHLIGEGAFGWAAEIDMQDAMSRVLR